MKPFRALGIRFGEGLRTGVVEAEVPDLSTFSERPSRSVHLDAVTVAPPAAFWTPLSGPVPGRLVHGTLPGDPHARFLLRLPKAWNGRLVVSGSPGLTCERGYDLYWSDFLLSRGYAFACTDKGVQVALCPSGVVFVPLAGENSIRRWFPRLKALTSFAVEEARKAFSRAPERIYVVGVSNGGFLARKAAEEGGVFDGAVDVSGVFWSPGRSLLLQLPRLLRIVARTPLDREALRSAGVAAEPDWDPVLQLYRTLYWENTLAFFVGDLDPGYLAPLTDYDLSARSEAVRESIAGFETTGDLAKPLISLSGKRDFLITHDGHFLPYLKAVRTRGKESLHRTIVLEKATHVDKDREFFPFVEPLMPKAHEAFLAMTRWVEEGKAP